MCRHGRESQAFDRAGEARACLSSVCSLEVTLTVRRVLRHDRYFGYFLATRSALEMTFLLHPFVLFSSGTAQRLNHLSRSQVSLIVQSTQGQYKVSHGRFRNGFVLLFGNKYSHSTLSSTAHSAAVSPFWCYRPHSENKF